jgi:hypothetical protein
MKALLLVLAAFAATRGTMEQAKAPGSFFLATEAAPGRFSDGEVIANDAVSIPFRIDVVWRRLGPEAGRSMHVTVADAVVLIKSGKIALYAFDEAKLAEAGWIALPGYDTHQEHAVSVTQTASEIAVTIDGKPAAKFALATARTQIRPGVGMKGAPGFRTLIYVRAMSVTAL